MSLCYVLFLFDCLLVVLSLSIGEWVHDPCYLQRPFAADRSAPLKVKSKNRCSPQERPSQKLKTKIETQPKPSSKRIENASLASFLALRCKSWVKQMGWVVVFHAFFCKRLRRGHCVLAEGRYHASTYATARASPTSSLGIACASALVHVRFASA